MTMATDYSRNVEPRADNLEGRVRRALLKCGKSLLKILSPTYLTEASIRSNRQYEASQGERPTLGSLITIGAAVGDLAKVAVYSYGAYHLYQTIFGGK